MLHVHKGLGNKNEPRGWIGNVLTVPHKRNRLLHEILVMLVTLRLLRVCATLSLLRHLLMCKLNLFNNQSVLDEAELRWIYQS